MLYGDKIKKFSLKKVYYLYFILFIILPIFTILSVALIVLNQQYRKQAIETIRQAQEAVIAELKSDEDVTSIRLSHMIYTNNNTILKYAADTDDARLSVRNESERKLSSTVNFILEPVKDVISVRFIMKDGREVYIKNEIKHSQEEIKQTAWYKEALENKNKVCIGYYDTVTTNDVYSGSKKDSLILVFALAPDISTDRSQKIEMVMFYQSAVVSERIREYNKDYHRQKNKLGITQITDENGNLVFATESQDKFQSNKYTCIKSPISFNDRTWYIENYIKTSELSAVFWNISIWVMGAALLIIIFAWYNSRYFLRSIVNPIMEISRGLRKVEEGDLEVHLVAEGQREIRNMIHQYNAMVRRLNVQVHEYEEKIRCVERKPEHYFAAMLKGEMTPEQVSEQSKEMFFENYALLGFQIENYKDMQNKAENVSKVISCFERNARFASRGILYVENGEFFLAFYRIREMDFSSKIVSMIEELQKAAKYEVGVQIFACIGRNGYGYSEFDDRIREVREKMCLRLLCGRESILNLNQADERLDKILAQLKQYTKLAESLYIADEKNLTQEKESLFGSFGNKSLSEAKILVYAVILAIGSRFSKDNFIFSDIFMESYDYFEKIERIKEVRSIKLWLTNYFAWIMEYSASKLNISETDAIVKAKRYISDNYENVDLSLATVAEHVGLNEKYLTNRFTQETGETFTSYLTTLRIQKSKELIKNTSFKVYEIAEMVGYNNVEHFNRIFKRVTGISPTQYRKEIVD